MKDNEHTLGGAIDAYLKGLRSKSKYDENYIINNWESMMGKTIAKYTNSIQIKNKKLYLSVSSAALRQELHYNREKMKKILNQNFDNIVIEDVILC